MALIDIAEIIPGIRTQREQFIERGNVLVISFRNLRENNKLILTESRKIYLSEQIENKILKHGDIIMSCGGSIGTICNMYRFDLPVKAVASQPLVVIRPRENQNDIWDKLNNHYYHLKLIAKDVHSQKRLSLNDLRNFEFLDF